MCTIMILSTVGLVVGPSVGCLLVVALLLCCVCLAAYYVRMLRRRKRLWKNMTQVRKTFLREFDHDNIINAYYMHTEHLIYSR